jgi:hydrogenase expression/formation protein HypC
MCLAIPGQIQSIEDGDLRNGSVSFGGMVKDVCLAFVPEAQVGDYVIVHVGFAISKVDEAAAQQTLSLYRELTELNEADKNPGFPSQTSREDTLGGNETSETT